jgi:hypothetical protein
MFKSISWQEYLYAVGVISIGYYALIIAVFYSRDILLKLKGAAVPKVKSVQHNFSGSKEKFMGAISNAPRKNIPVKQSIAETQELIFESDPEEMLSAYRADSLAAELFDTLEELFLVLASEKVEKPKYIKFIRTLFQQHQQIQGKPEQQDVNGFIVDYFKNGTVTFTREELDTLWLDEKEEVINKSTTKNNYEK